MAHAAKCVKCPPSRDNTKSAVVSSESPVEARHPFEAAVAFCFEIWASAPILMALDLQGLGGLSSSVETRNLMSIKKKTIALLQDSQSYFRMPLLAFAGSFPPAIDYL